jgi:mannan endo-1,4-beta-mannosidase
MAIDPSWERSRPFDGGTMTVYRRFGALVLKVLALAAVLAGATVFATQSAHAAAGFTVSGGRILDANGNAFVMRGVNHAHTWYQDRTPQALADIKALGANTVRIVLGSGQRWGPDGAANVSAVISQCKVNRLICVLEVHDTTGYGEQSGAATLAQAVDYWISIRSALAGQERYVILNIGNEPWGNTGASGWTDATKSAITRLRAAGFEHSIMVDAPNWGQDWQFVMRDNAASVFAADPQRNTIFSIHMYGVFDTAAEINDYLGRFVTAGLPIVVGEFGFDHSDGNPDEDTILATAQARGIGYLGWSWSGNGGGVEYLDMVTGFNAAQLTTWGQRLFNGANGIRATAREATVFGGTTPPSSTPPSSTPPSSTPPSSTPPSSAPPSSTPPSSAPPSNPPARGCTASYAVAGDWGSGFQGTVTVTAGSAAITGWTVSWTWPNGQRFTNTWNATVSGTGDAVTARNMSYNGSLAAGARTTWGFTASRGAVNTAPTVSCTTS